MYYSALVKKACQIAFQAHKEDLDKGGYPYVFHPFYLASQFDDEVTVCTALLHDVVEDHGDIYSFEVLAAEGFSEEILTPLRLLTHEKGVPYMEYIQKIRTDATATRVKIADLKHNMDSRRTDGVPTRKKETYARALTYLTGENGTEA